MYQQQRESEERMLNHFNDRFDMMSNMIRDESHLFIRNAVKKMSPAIKFINDELTGFGVNFENSYYFLVPGHLKGEKLNHRYLDIALLNTSSYPTISFDYFLNLNDKSVARAEMGDKLFAIGYDADCSTSRIWDGVVYSV